ncbi:MAG: outer membrane lipoprotein carrier protein LolA [Ginsengibacter sp.]
MKLFILGLSLLTVVTGKAQPQGMGKSDVDAKKVLDAVSAKFRSFKTVNAKFNLKIENAAGKVQGSKTGTVNMKGTKYRISVTGQELYSDGETSWTFDKSSNEVQINKVDASMAAITPQKLFTNFYDKDFLYKLNGETKQGKKTFQEVELTPIDKTKPFFKVLVTIDKTSQIINRTKVFEKNGNRYTYSVLSVKTNTALPDALFVFDPSKYPKVEIVDLR